MFIFFRHLIYNKIHFSRSTTHEKKTRVAFVRLISQNFNLKKPKKHEKNIFTIYSPKQSNNWTSRYINYRYRPFNQTT